MTNSEIRLVTMWAQAVASLPSVDEEAERLVEMAIGSHRRARGGRKLCRGDTDRLDLARWADDGGANA